MNPSYIFSFSYKYKLLLLSSDSLHFSIFFFLVNRANRVTSLHAHNSSMTRHSFSVTHFYSLSLSLSFPYFFSLLPFYTYSMTFFPRSSLRNRLVRVRQERVRSLSLSLSSWNSYEERLQSNIFLSYSQLASEFVGLCASACLCCERANVIARFKTASRMKPVFMHSKLLIPLSRFGYPATSSERRRRRRR